MLETPKRLRAEKQSFREMVGWEVGVYLMANWSQQEAVDVRASLVLRGFSWSLFILLMLLSRRGAAEILV